MMQELPAVEDLLETSDDAPIIRMLNALLTQAARDGASDIHIEPYERHSQRALSRRRHAARSGAAQPRAARGADLAPEDHGRPRHRREAPAAGRPHLAAHRHPRGGRARVARCPARTANAPCCACSTRARAKLSLESVGMTGRHAAPLRAADRAAARHHPGDRAHRLGQDHHAVCRRWRGSTPAASNIMTVEDPIEYELPGIGQTQVNAKIDLDFAKALRAILRQDPDVIMIGEIRDFETAQIAIQASLTGHLVLATLHTNDAASAVTRLTDMGVEPFLLQLVAAGRAGAAAGAQAVPLQCARARAAATHCGQTGYQGRTGVFELMVADDAIRAQIHNRAAEADIRAAALAGGMTLMRDDGERLVREGITSREEWCG